MEILSFATIFSDENSYSISILEEKLSSFPFITAFINLNGKEYLPSLLNLIIIKKMFQNETMSISNSSSSFFVYINGSIELFNSSNGKLIGKEIDVGAPIFYSRKTLYDQLTVKINSPSIFFEINTNAYNALLNNIIIEKTQKLAKFISTIKAFAYFQRVKKDLYEKLFQIAEEKTYKNQEIVYEENYPVDGIYFITKGSFLLIKKKPLFTKEVELKRLDKEIQDLAKEGKLLMKCFNGKYGFNSKTMNEYKSQFKNSNAKSFEKDNNNSLITKDSSSDIYLALMNENSIFGDFELISKEKIRCYTVQCTTDIGKAIFFSQDKFIEVCSESIISKINGDAIQKSKLLNIKYHSDMNISENKCPVSNMVNLPLNTDNFRLTRNNDNHKTRNNGNAVKTIKTLKTNIHFTQFDALRKEKQFLSFGNKAEFYLSKSNLSTSFHRNNLEHIKPKKDTHNLTHSFNIKTVTDKSQSFGNSNNSCSSNKEKVGNIFHSNQKSFFHHHYLNQNFLTTGVKYPSSITHYKKKLIFHINENKNFLKRLILKNNPRDIALSIRK